jgi:hypothetical protein
VSGRGEECEKYMSDEVTLFGAVVTKVQASKTVEDMMDLWLQNICRLRRRHTG